MTESILLVISDPLYDPSNEALVERMGPQLVDFPRGIEAVPPTASTHLILGFQ